ncbi:hypothetical protein GEMRC1_009317 [Eukaryota sp. GEM-RC1]
MASSCQFSFPNPRWAFPHSICHHTLYQSSVSMIMIHSFICNSLCPTTIIIPISSSHQLLDACQSPLDEQSPPIDVLKLKSQHFAQSNTLEYIKELDFLELPGVILPDQKPIALSHAIDFNCPCQLSSLSALIYHLQHNIFFSKKSSLFISSVEKFHLEGTLAIDQNSILALDILPTGKQSSFNLLEMFSKTSTPMGSRLMSLWVSRPISDLELLEKDRVMLHSSLFIQMQL